MLEKQIINIVVHGAGTIGKRHLMAINENQNVNLSGIIDISDEAKQFCENKKIPLSKNLNDLKIKSEIDGVIICTPTTLHYKNTLDALELGLDVLIEKPISANVSEAQTIAKIAQENNCKVLVGHQRRFYPLVIKAKEIVKNGEIGKIIGLSGVWALRKDNDYFDPDWRKKISAGPVITNLIHDIDYLRFIFGEIEAVSAYSSNNINNFEKEDILSANLKFKNGLLGNFLITDGGTSPWSWETGTGENIHLPHLKENNLRIIGTEGSLEFPNLKLWKYKNKGQNWKDEIEAIEICTNKIDAYALQIDHFRNVINRVVEPITGALDAELTLKVVLSILESTKSEKTIKI